MIGAFLLNMYRLICKFLIPLGNLINEFHFQNKKSIMFLKTFTRSLFDIGVCFLVKREMNRTSNEIKNQTAKIKN